jgi:hypothetical protein
MNRRSQLWIVEQAAPLALPCADPALAQRSVDGANVVLAIRRFRSDSALFLLFKHYCSWRLNLTSPAQNRMSQVLRSTSGNQRPPCDYAMLLHNHDGQDRGPKAGTPALYR